MSARLICSIAVFVCGFTGRAEERLLFSGERRLNNLVSELLQVASISTTSNPFAFTRSSDGWILISASCKGTGTVSGILDNGSRPVTMLIHEAESRPRDEAMRYVTKGEHTLQVQCTGNVNVEKLVVKAIPELIHCG